VAQKDGDTNPSPVSGLGGHAGGLSFHRQLQQNCGERFFEAGHTALTEEPVKQEGFGSGGPDGAEHDELFIAGRAGGVASEDGT
jgi:hypothetical protein